jgi:lipopolysaccharide/colanic/teichoic acid biosynthesis glycosyltransferase
MAYQSFTLMQAPISMRRTLPQATDSRSFGVEPPAGYWIVKRAIDIAISATALLLFAIPMLVIALIVKLDDPSGSIFYRQGRCGAGGRRFNLFKYRTMVKNADELKEELRAQSVVAWPDFRVYDDPRTTRIGRFLRKTSLDELPQLINVLRGDMALVGPRPTSFDVSTYQLWHTGRLEFRPGVTGPWQVLGRDSMDFDERCRLEISFFRHPSIRAELKLLLATLPIVVRRTGTA